MAQVTPLGLLCWNMLGLQDVFTSLILGCMEVARVPGFNAPATGWLPYLIPYLVTDYQWVGTNSLGIHPFIIYLFKYIFLSPKDYFILSASLSLSLRYRLYS